MIIQNTKQTLMFCLIGMFNDVTFSGVPQVEDPYVQNITTYLPKFPAFPITWYHQHLQIDP